LAEPATTEVRQSATPAPVALKSGPHLLVDDYFIARSEGVERKVVSPRRFLDAPVGRAVQDEITNAGGEPLPGFRFQDWRPMTSDSLAAPVEWSRALSTVRGQTVRLEFSRIPLRSRRFFGRGATP
jgi:hypothetical protein